VSPRTSPDLATRGAAFQNHRERTTGSIEARKLAELAVLDRDLFSVAATEISETKVLMTLIQGEIVYRSDEPSP